LILPMRTTAAVHGARRHLGEKRQRGAKLGRLRTTTLPQVRPTLHPGARGRRSRKRQATVSQPTIERAGSALAHSARKLEGSTDRIEDGADRRTQLAADRTVLAAERTYGAWVRTGLIALASGLGAKAGLAGVVPEWMILANGSVLVLFSAFCFA